MHFVTFVLFTLISPISGSSAKLENAKWSKGTPRSDQSDVLIVAEYKNALVYDHHRRSG
jgi:hypothetical protein